MLSLKVLEEESTRAALRKREINGRRPNFSISPYELPTKKLGTIQPNALLRCLLINLPALLILTEQIKNVATSQYSSEFSDSHTSGLY
jgi:hypothetical protein